MNRGAAATGAALGAAIASAAIAKGVLSGFAAAAAFMLAMATWIFHVEDWKTAALAAGLAASLGIPITFLMDLHLKQTTPVLLAKHPHPGSLAPCATGKIRSFHPDPPWHSQHKPRLPRRSFLPEGEYQALSAMNQCLREAKAASRSKAQADREAGARRRAEALVRAMTQGSSP